MINQLLTRLFLGMIATFASVSASASMRRVSQARGVNFIEYALLGVIAIFIGFVFRDQLSDAFNSILDQIRGGIGAGGRENG